MRMEWKDDGVVMEKVDDDTRMKLESALNAAATTLKKGLTMNAGGQRAENQYGAAYQALVQAGLRTQLRERYRG